MSYSGLEKLLVKLAIDATQQLQRWRAIRLNLTLYQLTERGEIVPVSAREYFERQDQRRRERYA